LSSNEILHQEKNFSIKKKITLLGGIEKYKDKFQTNVSSNCLPINHKQNIGVNISRINFLYEDSHRFDFLLWNIDCRQQRADLRSIFYNGAEAIIVFISETKIDQIRHYFNEIHSQMQMATLLFCVILENLNKDEIIKSHFINEDLNLILSSYNFEVNEIIEYSAILNQISSNLVKKMRYKELENTYIIDFIQKNLLFPQSETVDECNDYFEPQINEVRVNQIINTGKLIKFILKLDLDIEYDSFNWIKIKNKKFGTFSIFLKNGNVYYFPRICENCTDSKCLKLKKTPFFICIEADSASWTNINGLDQPELLILTKIFALKDGNESDLPKSVLSQIIKINRCDKIREKK